MRRDVLDFLGSRGGVEDDLLVISRVRPEDKGVYRCYPEGGRPEDFIEVTTQWKIDVVMS